MVAVILFGFLAVVVVMIFFLQYAEQNAPVKATGRLLAKEVIIAMSQQTSAAMRLPAYDGDLEWVQRFISNSCVALNFVPRGLKLQELVDEFCDRIDAIIDVYEANLIEYQKLLSEITAARQLTEKEVEKELNVDSNGRNGGQTTKHAKKRCGCVRRQSKPRKILRSNTIKACPDADDDKCFMDAFSQIVYPHRTGQELRVK